MLKKLLTGCLTIAMIGAFSASAAADTSFKWTGNVSASLIQDTAKEATTDAESVTEMNMGVTGDLDFIATVTGDVWTGTAHVEMDIADAVDGLTFDDVYVTMENESMEITFGEVDLVGLYYGGNALAEIDPTYGAGGNGSYAPNEQGWLQLNMKDVGLKLMLGINEVDDDADATGDQYNSTSYGVTFEKSFGDLNLGVQYVSSSYKIDEKNGDHAAADSKFDG